MQKTVVIGNQSIVFECNLYTIVCHKAQFCTEFMADINYLSRNRIKWLSYNTAPEQAEIVYHVLWSMAKTANDTIKPPDTFIDDFDEFPVFEIWDCVSNDVIKQSLKYDKKYRQGGSNTGNNNDFPSTEELTVYFLDKGLAVSDFRAITIGMAINLINVLHLNDLRAKGEEPPDREKQYKALKAQEKTVEKMYKNGEISELKYESYRETIDEWEAE